MDRGYNHETWKSLHLLAWDSANWLKPTNLYQQCQVTWPCTHSNRFDGIRTRTDAMAPKVLCQLDFRDLAMTKVHKKYLYFLCCNNTKDNIIQMASW